MAPDQWMFVGILFAAVIVFCIVVLTVAFTIRGKRAKEYASGPGTKNAPIQQDPWLRFSAALAAPYARMEMDRFPNRTGVSPDQAYFGFGSTVQHAMLRGLMRRDWGVRNSEQAHKTIQNTLKSLETLSPMNPQDEDFGLGFDVARFANLVRWAGNLGMIDKASAERYSAVLGTQAAANFDSWEQYGRSYVVGLENFSRRGNKPYRKAIDWLLQDSQSPWRTQAWAAGHRA
ncbi:DUF1266 domain-containing protein [Micrococcoides hystricis]|uniref:DUF1266 domain-containing protein n=1 Tax=Micrococcoides hystricis TaxID=1572761 RepID=A0ABV6PBE6_9MICC